MVPLLAEAEVPREKLAAKLAAEGTKDLAAAVSGTTFVCEGEQELGGCWGRSS